MPRNLIKNTSIWVCRWLTLRKRHLSCVFALEIPVCISILSVLLFLPLGVEMYQVILQWERFTAAYSELNVLRSLALLSNAKTPQNSVPPCYFLSPSHICCLKTVCACFDCALSFSVSLLLSFEAVYICSYGNNDAIDSDMQYRVRSCLFWSFKFRFLQTYNLLCGLQEFL